jgi:phenylalanyl-tRNA synthetase alpha chain
VGYLGKKGKMTELLKGMGNMSVEERKTIGAETNELKNEITVALAEKLEAMKAA